MHYFDIFLRSNGWQQWLMNVCGIMMALALINWLDACAALSVRVLYAAAVSYFFYYFYSRGIQDFAHTLHAVPDGQSHAELERLIHSCNVHPRVIRVAYGSLKSMAVNAHMNTIVIDPVLWLAIESSAYVHKVEAVQIESLAKMSVADRRAYARAHATISPAVQRFMVRRAVGHIYYDHERSRCVRMSLMNGIAVFVGLSASLFFTQCTTPHALWLAMLCAVTSSTILMMLSSVRYRMAENEKEDQYAARYSSRQECAAFADFLERSDAASSKGRYSFFSVDGFEAWWMGNNKKRAEKIRNMGL